MGKNIKINILIIIKCVIALMMIGSNVLEVLAIAPTEVNSVPPVEIKTAKLMILDIVTKEDTKIYNIKLSNELQEYTYDICKDRSVNYETILAVMKYESDYKETCISYNNNGTYDVSLMQLNSRYHYWHAQLIGVSKESFNPYDPKQNIQAGIMVFKVCEDYWIAKGITDKEELLKLTLLSYNRGIGGAEKYVVTNGLNNHYIDVILKYKADLENQ